ncbi:MAG: hypothetical protein WAS36_00995 [Candidatus Saccharimonadales bacterium]
MSNAEIVDQQIELGTPLVLSGPQLSQLKSGGLEVTDVAPAVVAQIQTSCLNEQAHPPSRYDKDEQCIVPGERNQSPSCGYDIVVDLDALAMNYLCAKSGDLCARRATLARATAEIVNRVAVYCVPSEGSIS